MRKIYKMGLLLFGILCLSFSSHKNTYAAGGVQATAAALSSNKIELKWNPVPSAGGYEVYRRSASEASFVQIGTTTGTAYQDTNVSAAVNYYYKIVPLGQRNEGQAEAMLKVKAPAKASIEKVKVKSPTKLEVSWKPAAGSNGYQVLRSETRNGGYTEVDRVSGKTACSYTDVTVTPGKTYYYKVRSMDSRLNSFGSYSAPMKGKTLAKTRITSIASLSSEKMQIRWKKVSDAQTYEVYSSAKKKGGYRKIASLRKGKRVYTDLTVKSGKKYYYKVAVTGMIDGTKISSGYSEPASFRALKQVKISSVKLMADDTVRIKWGKVTGATKYKIFRATSKSGSYKRIATVNGASVTNYTDKKVISGKTYYYKVQAYSDGSGIVASGSGNKSDAKGTTSAYAIMGNTTVTADQMAALFKASGRSYPSGIYKSKGAGSLKKFCEIVIDESRREGVKAEVIFAQVCLETGYLSFGGQVSAEQCNFSGLGATDDGAAGATFPDVKTGIRAQVQHLKGYASKDSLNGKCVDPRFGYLSYKRGCAKYVQDLGGGNWATDPNYATKLMILIKAMKSY